MGGKPGKSLRHNVEGKLQNHKIRHAISLDSQMESEGVGRGEKMPSLQACMGFLDDGNACSKNPRGVSKAGARRVLLLQQTVRPWSSRHALGKGLLLAL